MCLFYGFVYLCGCSSDDDDDDVGVLVCPETGNMNAFVRGNS